MSLIQVIAQPATVERTYHSNAFKAKQFNDLREFPQPKGDSLTFLTHKHTADLSKLAQHGKAPSMLLQILAFQTEGFTGDSFLF